MCTNEYRVGKGDVEGVERWCVKLEKFRIGKGYLVYLARRDPFLAGLVVGVGCRENRHSQRRLTLEELGSCKEAFS